MNQQLKEELAGTVRNFKFPEYREIPNVGLYLEQVTKYVSEYIEPLTGITITGSMISNYVKQKLLANPVKKMYYREQIAYVLFIAIAKSVLSLDNIKSLILMQQECCGTQEAYEYFCSVMEHYLRDVFELETKPDDPENKTIADDANRDNRELLCKLVIAISNKIYMESYFSRS